jgi:hypothetical protein
MSMVLVDTTSRDTIPLSCFYLQGRAYTTVTLDCGPHSPAMLRNEGKLFFIDILK